MVFIFHHSFPKGFVISPSLLYGQREFCFSAFPDSYAAKNEKTRFFFSPQYIRNNLRSASSLMVVALEQKSDGLLGSALVPSCLYGTLSGFTANRPSGCLLSEGLLPFSVTLGKRTTPLFLEGRNSDCLILPVSYASLTLQIPNFGEKS